MALEHLSRISEDQRLKQAAITREKTRRDYYWHLANAKKEGVAKGRKEGRKEGMETVALRLLEGGFELSTISKMTGLAEADIKALEVK